MTTLEAKLTPSATADPRQAAATDKASIYARLKKQLEERLTSVSARAVTFFASGPYALLAARYVLHGISIRAAIAYSLIYYALVVLAVFLAFPWIKKKSKQR